MNIPVPKLKTGIDKALYQSKLTAKGIPVCKPGDSGIDTVKAIDRLIMRRFVYTEDKDTPFNEKLMILGGEIEHWRSHHEQFAFEDTDILDDCDGFTATALQLAAIMDVPLDRLAFGMVVSEMRWHDKPAIIENMDHAIGMFYTGKTWLTFGDTWGQFTIPSMEPANVRHRVVAMAILDEGLTWRTYAE